MAIPLQKGHNEVFDLMSLPHKRLGCYIPPNAPKNKQSGAIPPTSINRELSPFINITPRTFIDLQRTPSHKQITAIHNAFQCTPKIKSTKTQPQP